MWPSERAGKAATLSLFRLSRAAGDDEEMEDYLAMNSLRWIIWVLGAVAAISLALLVVIGLTGDFRTLVTLVFWVSFIALVIALYVNFRNAPGSETVEV